MKFYLENHVPHINAKQQAISRHDCLIPFWADLNAAGVGPATFQRFCREMNDNRSKAQKQPYANDTLRTYIDHIEACFNYAFNNEIISKVPKIWKPEKQAPVKEFYTRKEIALLRRHSQTSYLPLFILIATYTGVRVGAILKLRWCHVDLEHDEIDFTFAQTSRNKGYSVVPIPAKLKRELLAHKDSDIGYVIHDNGKPIQSVKKAFSTAKRLAGVDGDMKKLRKTHGSWLKQKRLPSSFIAKNLGHSSTLVTDRVYSHLDEGYKKVIKEAF